MSRFVCTSISVVVLAVTLSGCGAGAEPQGSAPAGAAEPAAALAAPDRHPDRQGRALVLGTHGSTIDAWRLRLAADGPGPISTSWSASKLGDTRWRVRLDLERAGKPVMRAAWRVQVPLDRAPSTAEQAVTEGTDWIRPSNADARRLASYPPPAADGQTKVRLIAQVVGEAERPTGFALSLLPVGAVPRELVAPADKLDSAVLRGFRMMRGKRIADVVAIPIAGHTAYVDDQGQATSAEALRARVQEYGPQMVRITWKPTGRAVQSLQSMLVQAPVELVVLSGGQTTTPQSAPAS